MLIISVISTKLPPGGSHDAGGAARLTHPPLKGRARRRRDEGKRVLVLGCVSGGGSDSFCLWNDIYFWTFQ